MKRTVLFILLLSVVFVHLAGAANIQVSVFPTVAPNFFGSPNYSIWQTNAIQALLTNAPNAGTPNTPGYFEEPSTFGAADLIVSDFPSWRAMANPGVVFGPDFANELGNRLTFATIIRDTMGGQIDVVSGVNVVVPPFGTNPGFNGTGTHYTTRTIGVICVNGCGGGDDTLLTSGTGLADAIILFPGFGYEALSIDPLGATQANLDAVLAAIRGDTGNRLISDCTSFGGASNCGTAELYDVVPEPATISLLGIGLFALIHRSRRGTR